MLTILGMIPYIIVGAILSSMGYSIIEMDWQFFAIFGCMGMSDFITMLKHSD
jgi:hypothetical protein